MDRFANCRFVSIAFGTVEMPEPHFQCRPGRLFGYERIRNERAEPDSGEFTASVGKMNPGIAKRSEYCYASTSFLQCDIICELCGHQLASRGLRRKRTNGLTISMASIRILN